MNNNSYVPVCMEKIAELSKIDCPPVSRLTKSYLCIEYGGDCKECWKSWLTESEDNDE